MKKCLFRQAIMIRLTGSVPCLLVRKSALIKPEPVSQTGFRPVDRYFRQVMFAEHMKITCHVTFLYLELQKNEAFPVDRLADCEFKFPKFRLETEAKRNSWAGRMSIWRQRDSRVYRHRLAKSRAAAAAFGSKRVLRCQNAVHFGRGQAKTLHAQRENVLRQRRESRHFWITNNKSYLEAVEKETEVCPNSQNEAV